MRKLAGTIVIPLDTSAVSEAVLRPAAALAEALHYELLLLHVIAPATSLIAISHPALLSPGMAERWEADELTNDRQYLATVAQRMEPLGLSVRTTVRIATDTATAILACARNDAILPTSAAEAPPTIVAMTTHGQTGIRHWVLGSVAEQVIHHATLPVLLLRAHASSPSATTPATIRRVLVPLDGSTFAAHALPLAHTIASATGATLILLTVASPTDDIGLADGGIEPLWMLAEEDAATQHAHDSVEAAAQNLRAHGINVDTRWTAGDPATEIVDASTAEHADVIVMATHGRSGVQRLMLGSVAQEVLHLAEQPLLLVRPPLRSHHVMDQTADHANGEPIDDGRTTRKEQRDEHPRSCITART
ncbi:MAG TPA: universal stress protein [Herpetosiphonaceae bacterium]